jgi:3-phenylpropionate/cinnamic acid dioxygenase small subunit
MDTNLRIQRIEDELAISQLRAKYCHFMDDLKWSAFLNLFTEDGEFRGLSIAKGQAELKEFFTKKVPTLQEKFWHFCTNGTADVDGDVATGRISMEFFSTTAGRSYIAAGHYDDVMHRTNAGWKFRSRAITFYFYSPLDEGFTGTAPANVASVRHAAGL